MDTRCSLSTVACALKIVLDSRESTKEQILIQNKVNRCLTKFSRNNVCSLKIFVFRLLCVSVCVCVAAVVQTLLRKLIMAGLVCGR